MAERFTIMEKAVLAAKDAGTSAGIVTEGHRRILKQEDISPKLVKAFCEGINETRNDRKNNGG